ncbi:SLC13 family permease [Alicyclobacillus fastidiosus]|uniref:SLC13 family permease n=2 Tax=Alicyclobacillus fastidiosus TaxID=392011 RepID=A0ABY6ZGB3_9BACL|nr:SLC13 family permease [Alicyclobacillus fastidiosus]WAH41908.1 SLC13 family permease [Alicyclobacillus fastidiosus]
MAHSSFTLAGWETLGILLVVMIMLVSNRVRVDFIGVFILLALGITGVVSDKDLYSGFGNEAIIVIATMLALGQALIRSGITDTLSIWITRVAGRSERRLLSLLMLVGGLMSSIISDLAFVSIFLPVVLGFERHLKIRISRILLPLAITSMMGGLMTMVGSASSIVANQLLAKAHIHPLPLFSIFPVGLCLMATAMLVILTIGRFLLPNTEATSSRGSIGIDEYLTELHILPGSDWDGRELRDIRFFREHGINVVRVLRDDPVQFPQADTVLRAGDILLVQAHRDELLKIDDTRDFSVQSDVHESLEDTPVGLVAEALVRQGSDFANRTLEELDFRHRYEVAVLALWRNGQTITQRLAHVAMQPGDMLLLQGHKDNIRSLSEDEGLLMLSAESHTPRVRRKGILSLLILALTFALAAFNILPIDIAGLLGLGLMVILQILSFEQVYRSMEWHILVFVAAMIPLGQAMAQTGILGFLSDEIARMVGHFGPYALLAVCFAITALLTQVMSNTPTTLLLTPVMVKTATSLHYSPLPFVVTVIVAVTASPITYISHKVFLVIMEPGGYRYQDYARLGVPLTVCFFVITLLLVPVIWPFSAVA